MATKIIMTNKTALERKYGNTNAASILLSLNTMVAMDVQIRNISSFVLLLDDKNQMSMYGAKNVTDYSYEGQAKQVKEAIDQVYKSVKPDYILLLGGCDIIPFQHLEHPLDCTSRLESDLPYSCNASYSTSIEKFIHPERKVTRLPDTTVWVSGEKNTEYSPDAHNFIKVITNASKQKSHDLQDYGAYFAVTVEDFKESRQNMVKTWFVSSDKLACCPPHNGEWNQTQYDCLLHYFALYGLRDNYKWYEDKEGVRPVYECDNDRLYLNEGTIVISQCSYGAQLFEHKRKKPICNVYMENKASAFLGCTGEVESLTECRKSDDLITAFLAEINNQKTIAEAFLIARNKVVSDEHNVTAEEKLVLAQWVLYGDGIYQPIKLGGLTMENKTVTKLKELGIYEQVMRHNVQLGKKKCTDGEEENSVLPELPEENIQVFSPDNEKVRDNYIFVYPTTVSEVKTLVGVAEKTAMLNAKLEDNEHIMRLTPSDSSDLNALAYRYLILSESEMEQILTNSKYDLESVKKHITNSVKTLPVLCAGGTLEIKDGETVEITNTPIAIFENIVIHGSGTIKPDNKTKIVITGKLEHLN